MTRVEREIGGKFQSSGRFSFSAALFLSGVAFLLGGCTSTLVDSVQVSPTTQSIVAGQTVQFSAIGTIGHGNHPSSTQDVTTQVAWTSSAPAVATINSTGLATAVSAGTTTVTASMSGFGGIVSSTATLTVTGSSGGTGGTGGTGGSSGSTDVTSISIIPGTQSVASPGGIAQFLPIGSTAAGTTLNLSGGVVWGSSSPQIGSINASTGLATAVSQGSTTISALYTNPDKTVAAGTATFQVLSGSAEQVTALTMFPTAQAATAQAQQSQFTVLGTISGLQYDVTSNPNLAWTSSNLAVATVGTSGNGTPGLATAVGVGTTTIAATYTNMDGSKVVATGTYSVTIGKAQEPLLSINVVPAGTTVSNKGMTGQYLAFGSYSTTPTVRDLTDQVTWLSLLPEVASINSGGTAGETAGLATAQGYTGSTVIYAEMTNPDGTVVLSNSQTFTCDDPQTSVCDQGVAHPQFATITVFVEGENTSPTGEYVTAPSDTGTPDLIHCGPDWSGSGGQVCTGTYETGSTVVLTQNLPVGSTYFGGWSSGDGLNGGVGCTPAAGYTLANSPTCTVTLSGNASIGVIFY